MRCTSLMVVAQTPRAAQARRSVAALGERSVDIDDAMHAATTWDT